MGIMERWIAKPKNDEEIAELLCGRLSEGRAREVKRLSHELGVQRMDLIRAALEMALPVFREHPEYFVHAAEKADKPW